METPPVDEVRRPDWKTSQVASSELESTIEVLQRSVEKSAIPHKIQAGWSFTLAWLSDRSKTNKSVYLQEAIGSVERKHRFSHQAQAVSRPQHVPHQRPAHLLVERLGRRTTTQAAQEVEGTRGLPGGQAGGGEIQQTTSRGFGDGKMKVEAVKVYESQNGIFFWVNQVKVFIVYAFRLPFLISRIQAESPCFNSKSAWPDRFESITNVSPTSEGIHINQIELPMCGAAIASQRLAAWIMYKPKVFEFALPFTVLRCLFHSHG